MISVGLQTLLLAQSSVTDIVGTAGVFVTIAKQSASKPYVVIDRVNDEKHGTLGGYLGAKHCEVEIECWDTTPQDAAALADIISDFLDDYTGTAGDETILESTQVDHGDNFSKPKDNSEVSEYVTTLYFEFQYTG